MILTITLNPTIDIVAVISAIKLSSVTRSPDIFSYPGGKATNTARAAAALGAKVIAAGFAGASDIAAMNSFFSKHNVTGSFTAVPGKNRICLLLTETETKQETIINSESNLRISVSKKSELLETVAALSKKATHAVISGSLPLCLPSNFYATLINKIKNN